jgi:hypothetical protein
VLRFGAADERAAGAEIPVLIRLLNTGGLTLQPRLSADVRIEAGFTEPVLSIPLSAITSADGHPGVWEVSLLGRLQRTAVKLGRSNPDRVELIEGLSPGRRVVSVADPNFEAGMRVRVTEHAGTVSPAKALVKAAPPREPVRPRFAKPPQNALTQKLREWLLKLRRRLESSPAAS